MEADQSQPPVLPERPFAPFDAYHNYVQIYTTAFHLTEQISTISSRYSSLLARLAHLQVLPSHPALPPESTRKGGVGSSAALQEEEETCHPD